MAKKPIKVDKKAPPTEKVMSAKEAQEILRRQQQQKYEMCKAEVDEVLEKYQMTFDVAVIVRANGNTAVVNIVPRPVNPQRDN